MSTLAVGVDTARLRKARGAFFTPEAVARYVSSWAVRGAGDQVLEPSCGEAAFLLAALERQVDLAGADPDARLGALAGVELHPASAQAARSLMDAAGSDAQVTEGDFFAVEPEPVYDAVIGNPPYIRYQDFSGASRSAARAAALRAGVSLSGLASSWAAFTVHAALFLKPGGRLGLVVPAELMSVNYAAQVRQFLMRRFARVRLVMFTERIFPGVLEEVVLLLAEGTGGTDHCELVHAHSAQDLAGLDASEQSRWSPVTPTGKWTSALLTPTAASAYTATTTGDAFTTLNTWGDTRLGMVTGANSYFALSPTRAAELDLPAEELLALSPPGSRHLRALSFTTPARTALGAAGAATWLFRPPGEPSRAARAYIDAGQAAGVDQAYKCQVRSPWWRVPLLAPADVLVTYMNADTPRLTTNTASALHLNSVHGLYLRPAHRDLGRALLPLASLNSATVLGAELVGRAYGGGMLKVEPREADALPMPTPALVASCAPALRAIRARVLARLRAGRLSEAIALVDHVLLTGALGLGEEQVGELQRAHLKLAARRRARGASAKDRAALAGAQR